MLIDYKQVKIYQQEKLILDQVDFHVEEGEFVVSDNSSVP